MELQVNAWEVESKGQRVRRCTVSPPFDDWDPTEWSRYYTTKRLLGFIPCDAPVRPDDRPPEFFEFLRLACHVAFAVAGGAEVHVVSWGDAQAVVRYAEQCGLRCRVLHSLASIRVPDPERAYELLTGGPLAALRAVDAYSPLDPSAELRVPGRMHGSPAAWFQPLLPALSAFFRFHLETPQWESWSTSVGIEEYVRIVSDAAEERPGIVIKVSAATGPGRRPR